MKKSIFSITLILATLLATSSAMAAERAIRLNMTSQYMDRHPVVVHVFKPWIEEIKTRSNGRVLITYYNPNTLCPDGEVYDALLKGQVHIAEHLNSRNPGRLPINTVTNKTPMLASSATAGSLAYWELFKENPNLQKELAGVKMLSGHASAPTQVHTKKAPVTTLEEFGKLKMIGASKDSLRMIAALGGNGIMVPSPDIYMSLQRNMADGTVYPIPPLRSFKINEATRYTTYLDGLTGSAYIAMNQSAWESLPADIQQIFAETTGDVMAMAVGKALDKGEVDDLEILKKDGHQFLELAPAEKERWRAMVTPAMKQEWIIEIEGKGVADPEALFSRAVELLNKYNQEYGRK